MKMKVLIKKSKGSFVDFVAFPLCENSLRACKLVNRNFLKAAEIKLLELMGFNVEAIENNNNTQENK